MIRLDRGSIHRIFIEAIGKNKYVLVLQGSRRFAKHRYVEVLLITSDKGDGKHEKYDTDIELTKGMAGLPQRSWVLCDQQWPIERSLFEDEGVLHLGRVSNAKMEEIETALFKSLEIGFRHKVQSVYAEVEPVSMTLTVSADLSVAKAPPKERE